ncbi:11056_t:CDS:2 [Acaulospora colombiana]|uniref:11056_t:CDS:1 n=1 Tax=Acaulospora colombiana TaxID=27376 RepID=A0ACA9KJL1_9GLOM|nr:11056_t:CDS:2 [Acaulospora colombiana]
MGGFVSILSAVYFILFGSQKINPWGIVQRYVLKNVPPPPSIYSPTATLYSDVKVRPQDIEAGDSHVTDSPIQPTDLTPEHKLHKEYVQRYSQGPLTLTVDMDDPKIQEIRHELRAEVQRTIANELAKLRLFLSKYYLKDIIKAE